MKPAEDKCRFTLETFALSTQPDLRNASIKATSSLSIFLDRNEPARFFGDGVIFKAKLIGILEVGEARGDRMCQEALQDLKIAIRAAGEHKQRITIHVTIEGLRLRDEKTGVSTINFNRTNRKIYLSFSYCRSRCIIIRCIKSRSSPKT